MGRNVISQISGFLPTRLVDGPIIVDIGMEVLTYSLLIHANCYLD